MIQKRIASKYRMGLFIFGMVLLLGLSILAVITFFDKDQGVELRIFCAAAFVMFVGMLVLCVLSLNRGACIVWIDPQQKIIGRRGLFGGYRLQVSVNDVQTVVVRYEVKDGKYFYVVDRQKRSFDCRKKNSYIYLAENEENLRFLRQVWFGLVEDQTGDEPRFL